MQQGGLCCRCANTCSPETTLAGMLPTCCPTVAIFLPPAATLPRPKITKNYLCAGGLMKNRDPVEICPRAAAALLLKSAIRIRSDC